MNKRKIILIIIPIIAIAVLTIIIYTIAKKNPNEIVQEDKNANNYEKIKDIVDNEKESIIYYYNSTDNNPIVKEIKNYLDEKNIKYDIYDDHKIKNEEYNKILNALEIDSDIFGLPAIIYIYNGKVYSNIININDIETVKLYVEENELVNVK